MKNNMRIHKAISVQTSKEEFYNKAEELGTRAAKIFKEGKGKTQLNSLLNLVNSSLRVTDTINYIKRQIGHRNRGFEEDNFGNDLIDFLYNDLKIIKNSIASELKHLELNDYEVQQIHLLLCRQFISSMVIHYNYQQREGFDAISTKF